MLFQLPKISRDVQNMMPKIITYRSRPKKCKSSASLFDEIICNEIFDGKIHSKSKNLDDIMNEKKAKNSRVQKEIEVSIARGR